MENIELAVRTRRVLGKRVQALRRQGLTPANLYGSGISSLALEVKTATLQQAMMKAGRNVPVALKIEEDGRGGHSGERREMALIWGV